MNRFGKSFKNRFLAMALAGAMVMSSVASSEIPVFAAQTTDVESTEDGISWDEPKDSSEEGAEDEEIKQRDSEEKETEQQENKKPETESGTTTKKESTTAKEEVATEELETDSEDAEESQTDEAENKAAAKTSVYNETEGNDEKLVKYNLEGFASSYGVTGGGLLKAGANDNYIKVGTEKEFLEALKTVRKTKTTPTVIEITADLNLGNKELATQNITVMPKAESEAAKESDYPYCKLIRTDEFEPLTHPTLKDTGVSDLLLQDMQNLTIFSKNGSAIKHCDIIVKRTKNLIIRNIKFDELWEWDEETSGDYDRNDWDYIGIEQSDGIWIDHCTFYKAYDGIIDIKDPDTISNVTISWCRFLPASENETFFNEQMKWLEDNKASTEYYKKLRDTDGATQEHVRRYAYGQKKTHLLGQGDSATNAVGIKLTLANNYYYDSMDRMPRLRYGTVHEYNCVLDAKDLYEWRNDKNNPARGHITSNGAISTCNGKMLLENCYIRDIVNPLNSGNGSSPTGYINAVDSCYYLGNSDKTADLKPTKNTSHSSNVLTTNAAEFRSELPYSDYIKYPASSLNTDDADSIKTLAGARNSSWSEAQWEKTSYGKRDTTTNPDNPDPDDPKTDDSESKTEEFKVGDDVAVQEALENDLTVNEFFTIKKGSQIAAGTASIDGKNYTKRVQFGAGSSTQKSIQVTSPGKGKLTVYAASSNASETRTIKLIDAENTVDSKENVGATVTAYTLEIPKKGVYYVVSEMKTLYIYGMVLEYTEDSEGGDNPGPGTSDDEEDEEESSSYQDIELILNASDLEAGTHTTDLPEKKGFTIKATSSKNVVVDPSYIDLKGSGAADNRSIHFTAEAAGTLTVNAYVTSSEARELELCKKDGASVSTQSVGGSTATAYTYDITESGGYYIRSKSGAIRITSIKFTCRITYITKTLKFRATKLDTKKLTEDLPVGDYFTVRTDSEITGNGATIGEKTFTKRVEFSEKGNTDSSSIQIKALDKGTLTIYAASDSATARTVNLLNEEGVVIASQSDVGAATSFTLEIPKKGVYYIAPAESGLYLYGIDFRLTYKEGESLPEEPAKAPTFTAPEGDSVYGKTEGNDPSKVVYNIEGYAASANVTGGGLLKENDTNYYTVTNEQEFINALNSVRSLGTQGGLKPGAEIKPAVIEIKNDLNLGWKELSNQGIDVTVNPAKTVMEKAKVEPAIHPTLKETGVSTVKLNYFHNLTIYSKNGASIKHAGISFEGESSNIIIRNITFDELWEWDEATSGDYDRNDWDYITVKEQTDGLWIDHCTFYKAYDGMLDIKGDQDNKVVNERVTISWCEFLPGSKNNTFFNEQMTWLEKHLDETTYYKKLRQTENMSKEDVWWYAYGQKKAMLFGPGDDADYASKIRVTIANSHYKNIMDRMPRLRFGRVHEYNCVLDGQNLYTKKNSGSSGLSSHITSQGAISACGGEMLLENCYIRGIKNPLYSGNGNSPRGYINAIESIYYLDGSLQGNLTPVKRGPEAETEPLITDTAKFKAALPYSDDYVTYDAMQLYTKVVPYAGAGKLDLSTVQWEKTTYGDKTGGCSSTSAAPANEPAGPNDDLPKLPWDETENPDNPPADTIAAPTATPDDGTQFPSGGGTITLKCDTADVTIYYTTSSTENGLTDPSVETNTDRIRYTKGTEISITEETYIWAVAIKDGKASEPLKCHYTVLAEGAIVKPTANPGSETQPTEVLSGTKVALNVTDDTIENIYYTMGSAPNDPREENSGRHTYSDEITITEATTIKAVAQKGDKYSDVAIFTYTIKADVDPDPDKTVAAPTFSKAGGAVEKGEKITITCTTEGASIYYTTNGNEPKAESQFLYTKGTEIVINETTTIRAIAVKDGESSTESKVTYTVNNEEIPPEIKTIKLSECTITVPSVMESTKKGWVPQSVTYVTYKYTNENGQTRYVKFAEGVDYDVDWTPGKQEDGTYKVILTGRGRTTDGRNVDGFVIDENSTEEAFYMVYKKPEKNSEIKLVDISKAKVSLDKNAIKNLCYTGYAHEPDLDYSKDKDGLEGKLNIAYKNNINAGKASVIISAKPGADTDTVKYVGSKTLTFTIKKAALNKNEEKATALVSFDKDASERQQYISGAVTAKGLKVETVVTSGNRKGVTLRKDEDYTVTYKNSVKNGTVTVTMTVKGVGNNLSGNCAKTFTMEQLDLTDVSLTEGNGGNQLPYSSKGAKLGTITVTKDGSTCTLKEGVDYTAKYEYDKTKKKDAGSNVKITVKGKGVCKGQSTAAFDIVQADFNSADIIISEDVTVDTDELDKNREDAKRAKVFAKSFTVKDAAGAKLNANKDYTIEYEEAEKTITITPTGKNAANYTGAKTFSYRVAKNLAKDKSFIFNKDLEKRDPLAYDGRNPVKLTTADIDKYINNDIKPTDPAYNTRTYRLGGQNANIEIVPGTYKNNTKKGTAQVTVRGIAGVDGGFYGTKVLKFKIVDK